MKKTIILILAVLPIVLLVVIAFAGQILHYYQHIPVESLEFVNESNDPYEASYVFRLEQGTTAETKLLVHPELASNKKVFYTSENENVCKVDENGVLTGVHYGSTTVIAKSEDGGKITKLNVTVTADTPVGITLSKTWLSMLVGENYQLEATVDAPVAVDKNVTFTSSDPSVARVDASGKITALKAGEVVITARTVLGNLVATCAVTVDVGALSLSFDLSGVSGVTVNESGRYLLSDATLDLGACLRVGEGIDPDTVELKIQSGSVRATLVDGILHFTAVGPVTVRAYAEDASIPFAELDLAWLGD